MSNIKNAISEIHKTIIKYGLDYNQTKGVFKAARNLAGLSATPSKKGAVDILTLEEEFRFMEAAYQSSGRIGLMMQTLLETGARVTAFTKIRIEDISFAARLITIHEGKGNKRRSVPIRQELAEKLKIHIDKREAGPLFRSRQKPYVYTRQRIGQIVKEVAIAAKVHKRVHPHLMRHTIATKLIDEGMDIIDVAKFLGHDDVKTTQIYAKTSTANLRKKFDQITADPAKKMVGHILEMRGDKAAAFAVDLLERA